MTVVIAKQVGPESSAEIESAATTTRHRIPIPLEESKA